MENILLNHLIHAIRKYVNDMYIYFVLLYMDMAYGTAEYERDIELYGGSKSWLVCICVRRAV